MMEELSKNWTTKELSNVRRVLLKLHYERTSKLTVDASDIDFYLHCNMYFACFVVLLWRFGLCPLQYFYFIFVLSTGMDPA